MNLIPSFTVLMEIHDVLYLSYLIPEKRLRPAVPDTMPFAVTSQGKTIISLVIFHSRNVRASFFPFFRFDYDQANIRTYVLDPVTGKPAVFFLKSGITSPLIAAITRILGIPWQSVSMRLDVQRDNNSLYQYAARGDWEGDFNISLQEDRDTLADMEPFRTPEEAIHFLTSPSVGFYGSSGGVIRFEVQHSAIKPSMGKISAINFPLLIRSGLLTDGELWFPHSALIAPRGLFSVSMPPTRVSQ
ncbi:MAG: hypothetical protein C0392_08600 [Syntrophus sp. (in: bacteria)]|nr:hypothetical protein [Syntrophus sp. (in: bacteria)]